MEKPVTPPPLEVECSPRTFQRIQSDPEYLQEVVAQHLAHASTIDEDFVPNSSTAIEDFVAIEELKEETYDGPPKQVWLEAATKLLLVLIKEMAPKVGKSMKLKTKKKMWQAIKDRLAEKGYGFSVTQIEAKYRSLERQYKRIKVHNGQTGRNRMTCPFENEINSITEKTRGVFPEYILGNDERDGVSRSELMQKAGVSSQESHPSTSGTVVHKEASYVSPARNHKRISSTNADIMQELREMRQEKKQLNAKILRLLQEKEERGKRKERLAERRCEILEKYLQMKT